MFARSDDLSTGRRGGAVHVGARFYRWTVTETAQSQTPRPTFDQLLDEYDQWRALLDRGENEFGAVNSLVAIYRHALAHANEPGIELLLDALSAAMKAEREAN